MDTTTVLGALETEERPETILRWTVECPVTGGLAEAEIGARVAPFAMFCTPRIEVKSCTLWPEKRDCGHQCIRNI
jgi:hypothetical protein